VSQSLAIQQRFHAWLLEHAEETILRWIFRSAVLVALGVLAVDLASINGWIIDPDPAVAPAEIREDSPSLNLPRLGPVEIHREFITAAARWMFAAKL
jgi:hypothetical protein